jgi:hypothetical protein
MPSLLNLPSVELYKAKRARLLFLLSRIPRPGGASYTNAYFPNGSVRFHPFLQTPWIIDDVVL